jgi:hypothetical protein
LDRQRDDRLGRIKRQRLFEHRRQILRAIWSPANAHDNTDRDGNANPYAYADPMRREV